MRTPQPCDLPGLPSAAATLSVRRAEVNGRKDAHRIASLADAFSVAAEHGC